MSDDYRAPQLPLPALFLKFLRFGFLAWGGPVAQIGLLREELVHQEKWVSSEQFNRVLAVYQVLPGPEAHELCVYFGMLSRGRTGAVLAGLGFMLPGFLLMFALSALYVRFGLQQPWVLAAFAAVQAAVAAMIVRAVVRIGQHSLRDAWLWAAAVCCLVAQLAGVPFLLALGAAGLAYAFAVGRGRVASAVILAAIVLFSARRLYFLGFPLAEANTATAQAGASLALESGDPGQMFFSGLRTGLLTFGGAYTAIPFLQADAVEDGRWMSNAQFLDGLALGGVLPAPLIIFSTFVGYLGAGALGAVLMTAGVFLPAFAFTLLGHDFFEQIIHRPSLRRALDGVAAGVVGLIAATGISLLRSALTSPLALGIFGVALAILFYWKARWAIAAVVLGAAAVGLAAFAMRAIGGPG